MGKKDYRPENDHRHFLYREYLRVLQNVRPAVFVMENVKGILSSKVKEAGSFTTSCSTWLTRMPRLQGRRAKNETAIASVPW